MTAHPAQETTTIPQEPEYLYVGIDVAKNSHVAAFVSGQLLARHKNFGNCPVFSFENSRIGFESLVRAIEGYGGRSRCTVVLERTGHYHLPLLQYLQEQDIETYELHLQKRPTRNKSDKRDALGLANLLYSQLALGAQVDDPAQQVHRVVIASPTATLLRGLIRHRIELVQEAARRKNKLIAICDQLFPEAALVIADLNGEAALRLWERYGTAAAIAAADLFELVACRTGSRPGRAVFRRLQEVAGTSIGVTDPARVEVLSFERRQLIIELRLLQHHLEAIDDRIAEIVEGSREGQILCSLPIISPMYAAAIIASIGTIANFESASKLRGYFGWAPNQRQTGISMDSMRLTKGGNRTMKRTMYLIGWQAIKLDTEWRDLYQRLIPIVCRYDARTGKYKGKNRAIGRIIGTVIGLIYYLLKKDYDLIASLKPDEPVPPPMLYNREVHRSHRRRLA